jgi:hypothetical protein
LRSPYEECRIAVETFRVSATRLKVTHFESGAILSV